MTTTFVQADGNRTAFLSTSVAVSPPLALTLGNAVLVAARSDHGETITGVSDTIGSTYDFVNSSVNGNIYIALYRAKTNAGGSTTITATASGSCNLGIDFMELSGTNTTEPIGTSVQSKGTDTSPTASITLSAGEDFAVSWVGDNGVALLSAQSLTIGSGWTQGVKLNGDGFGSMSVGSEYQAGVTGTLTGDWTDTPSVDWVVVMASIVPAAATVDLFAQTCM